MARAYHMSWDGPRGRWVKMYKGQRFTVACSVLGVPATKDASYQAANAWWAKKELELATAEKDKQPRPLNPLEETALAALVDKEQGEELRRAFHDRGIDIRHGLPLGVFDLYMALAQGRLPEGLADRLAPDRVKQIEEANRAIRGQAATPPDKTVEGHVERWLKKLQAKVDAGRMTAARCANNRTCLEQFKKYLGPQSDVTGVNAQTVEGFYLHCLAQIAARHKDKDGKQGWSVAYARDVFAVARAFIRWLWECGTIELPKNIDSRSFDFGSHGQAVKTWTVAEFQKVVTEAPGKLKLAILLMANCGMTQADVSDLLDAEVDWAAGRITRKRSKTKGEANVPTVCYQLWPVTFDLLKKYRSGRERVLLTEAGEPYVRTRLNDQGRLVKADGFASNYAHVQRRLKLKRPLKQLRKLGASLLSSHKDYGRFASYFLGHSPRTVADRHYVVPPQELFDQAIAWLGRQLGQVT